jgi:hypothetical protein
MFLSNLDTFISFSYPITRGEISSTMLRRSSKCHYLCIVPRLTRKAFSFSPLYMMFYVGFHIWFYYSDVVSFHSCSLECCYHERMLNLVKWFFCFSRDNFVDFFFILLIWYITFIPMYILNHPCMQELSPTLSSSIIILISLWI